MVSRRLRLSLGSLSGEVVVKRYASWLQAAGLGVFAVGAGLVHLSFGLMVAGAGCVLFGLALERD